MKTKFYYTLALLAFTFSVNAQDYFFANGDFEIWKDTMGYREPKGWATINSLSIFGLEQSTTRDGDAHSGDHAAKLVTQANSFQDFPAVLSSANILNSQNEPDLNQAKVPFTMRPKNFSFYYKAMPGVGDSCSGLMILSRWNMAEQKSDTIAVAGFYIKDSVTTYTQMVVPFRYESPLMPDSAMILIASSANAFDPVPGSTLFIDDFVLGFETGLMKNANILNNVSVYPNPANDVITVKTEEKDFSFGLFDLHGRSVSAGISTGSQCEINTAEIPAGVYIMEISNERGTAHEKIMIVR